jgi:pimeloyl-ACP methyl ester carboxylesterase
MNDNLKSTYFTPATKHRKVAHKMLIRGWVMIGLLFLTTVSIASDKEKEKRWAEQVTDALMDGEAVYLKDAKEEDFLALDMPAEEKSEVGILVIHGIGIHPDWEQIINPVRVGLAEAGWHTLSLQMPILKNTATGKDYLPLLKEVAPRIDAGIAYLKKAGVKKIVLVSHSLGAQMTSYYLANPTQQKKALPIIAYVAFGMNTPNTALLKKIKLPVFDLYGSEDLEGVLTSAPDRVAASSDNKGYKQQKVTNANHFFDDKNEVLLELISHYLKTL